MNPRTVFVTLCLTIFAWGCGAAVKPTVQPVAQSEIVLKVTPRWAMGMFGSFHVLVRIKPDIDNRWLTLIYDGPKYRSSTTQLDELNSDQETFDFLLPDLPSGNYVIQAILSKKVKGELISFSDYVEVAVCGPGMDTCGSRNDGKF